MARHSSLSNAASEEIAAIEALIGDLEKRLRKLNTSARRHASETSSEVGEFMSQTVSDLAGRLRAGASSLSGTVADEAGRLGDDAYAYGSDALKRLEEEIEQRPLVTLAIAAAIGFLIGIAGRRR